MDVYWENSKRSVISTNVLFYKLVSFLSAKKTFSEYLYSAPRAGKNYTYFKNSEWVVFLSDTHGIWMMMCLLTLRRLDCLSPVAAFHPWEHFTHGRITRGCISPVGASPVGAFYPWVHFPRGSISPVGALKDWSLSFPKHCCLETNYWGYCNHVMLECPYGTHQGPMHEDEIFNNYWKRAGQHTLN